MFDLKFHFCKKRVKHFVLCNAKREENTKILNEIGVERCRAVYKKAKKVKEESKTHREFLDKVTREEIDLLFPFVVTFSRESLIEFFEREKELPYQADCEKCKFDACSV